MTMKENIRAILESIFSGFKEELIDIATKNICDLEQEPKTGHWIMHGNHRECSKCKVWFPKDMPRNSYCPNCGAKMSEIPTGAEGSEEE